MDVKVLTRHGRDLPRVHGLRLVGNAISRKATTRFKILLSRDRRRIWLESRCAGIVDIDGADAAIISPVARELTRSTAKMIADGSGLTYLDPQGFIRNWGIDGEIYVERRRGLLRIVDVVKMDEEEGWALTGSRDPDVAARTALRSGVRYVIATRGPRIRLYSGEGIYEIMTDTTEGVGLGDMLAAGFVHGILDGDPLWGLAVGASTATVRAREHGVSGIPSGRAVLETADSLVDGIRRKT